jgi:ABC-type Na+ transport system ATPase subunit NatA
MTIRIVVADDQHLVRAGLCGILATAEDLVIVGEAATGREAVDVVRERRPDVVLMDVRMPDMDGLAATRLIVRDTDARVVVLTTFDLDEYVIAALEAGASGYSLGMRQRLGLAAAMLGDPAVLVLDEPGNGLDPAAQVWLRRVVRAQADRGRTVLLSTHLLSEVSASADRVLVISGGRLKSDTTPQVLTGSGETLEDAYLRLVGDQSDDSSTEPTR